jgi:hypothetical protein
MMPWLRCYGFGTFVAATLAILHAGAGSAKNITVMSMNLACRDTVPLAGCDNCDVRFSLIAEAIRGDNPGNYTDVPDFDTVDVIIAQEIATDDATLYAEITSALGR